MASLEINNSLTPYIVNFKEKEFGGESRRRLFCFDLLFSVLEKVDEEMYANAQEKFPDKDFAKLTWNQIAGSIFPPSRRLSYEALYAEEGTRPAPEDPFFKTAQKIKSLLKKFFSAYEMQLEVYIHIQSRELFFSLRTLNLDFNYNLLENFCNELGIQNEGRLKRDLEKRAKKNFQEEAKTE